MSKRSPTQTCPPDNATMTHNLAASFDSDDAAGVDQPGPQPGSQPQPLYARSHNHKKKNQPLHVHLSDIPEEDRYRTGVGIGVETKTRARTGNRRTRTRPRIRTEIDNIKTRLASEIDGGDHSDRDRDIDDQIERDQEPEHKHEDDVHKRGRLKLFIQHENDLRILSSSSSSQTDLHFLTNASLSNAFPDSPFDHHQGMQLHQNQRQQQQHHQHHSHGLYPTSTGSSLNTSSNETSYGSIQDSSSFDSTLISAEQSSLDASLDASDGISFTTVKVRNSNDSLSSFKYNDHHHNNSDAIRSSNNTNRGSSTMPTTITKIRLHNTHPRPARNKATHKSSPLSPKRKSRLNDLARAAQHQCEQRQQQQYCPGASLDSATSLSSNTNVPSEATPILPTAHQNHHHQKYHANNPRRKESLHRIHNRQRCVARLIGNLNGVEQSTSFRDVQFSLLFFVQMAAMIFLAISYGPEAVESAPDAGISPLNQITAIVGSTPAILEEAHTQILFTGQHVIMLVTCSGLISIVISTLALIFMTLVAEKLVEIALYVAFSLALAWGTIGAVALSSYSKFVPITALAMLGLITAYAFVVWDRIPFASANLKTALTAIRSNYSQVVAVAYALQVMMLIWSILTIFTVVGIYNALHSHVVVNAKWRVGCYVGIGVSFFWSVQLFVYMVHVTVAGVVKNWWFHETSSDQPPRSLSLPRLSSNERQLEERRHLHESVVTKSFQRAAFHSFGSVCFGSLLVNLFRILRRVPKYIHPFSSVRDNASKERPVSFMDVLGMKFNRFAFIYVGMYGYNFVEAGERASALLKKRGWKTIVTDNLLSDVLLLVSLVIGGVSGCLTVWIESVGFSTITSIHNPTWTSFLIGFIIGLALSFILFGIIISSVNAVIMLFAGNPVEFEENHPELSHEMRAAWKEVFPGKVDFVEMNGDILRV